MKSNKATLLTINSGSSSLRFARFNVLESFPQILTGKFERIGLPNAKLSFTDILAKRSDEGKGEALIAVTNEPKLTLEEIRAAIKAKGLTNLSTPREVKVVKEIPKLGTGKVNHRELQSQMESAEKSPAPPAK